MFIRTLNTLFFVLISSAVIGQNSVLSSGQWYKIGIQTHGIYSITVDQLKKMGFNTSSVDPRKIKIFGQRGGVVPQANSVQRPQDLVELSIIVNGEDDGKLNSGDYILFYAEGPDKYELIPDKSVFKYENNFYSDKNFYFVTVGDTNGKRIQSQEPGNGGTTVNVYDEFIFHETDEFNLLQSGREWFGEDFGMEPEQTFTLEIEGMTSEPATFVSSVMSQALSPSSFKIFFNDQLIGEQFLPAVQNSTYDEKGKMKNDSLHFAPATINASKQTVRFAYQKPSGDSKGYLNYFSLHFKRQLALYGNQTIFRTSQNGSTTCSLTVSNISNQDDIWNISNPYEPLKQKFNLQNSSAIFTSPASTVIPEFIVFNSKYLVPELIGKVSNQNLHGLTPPDYIIISYPDFKSEAERLANHRSATNNWNTVVVTPEEIYNEFSSGRQDVSAIRDFIKHLYDKNPDKVRSVLLFGKCSFDYKDRVLENTNFVPSYESRNSLAPLETYSSDDFYAFLGEDEGEWPETSSEHSTLDIAVGRLPVKTTAEARIVVDKLINYDTSEKRFGRWRKDFVFVADDGSNSDSWSSIHQSQANSLAESIESDHPELNTRKIFIGTYAKDVYPYGERIPAANKEIAKEFDQSLIINYTGHGAETIWADERILTEEMVQSLKNKHFPFLVTATCEFGRHDSPLVSCAELTLLKENAGSIGLVTTARPVNSSTNFTLNNAFYDAMFDAQNQLLIGEIFRDTKNNSTSGVSNRNFSLLGDPGMKLAIPSWKIEVDEIKTTSGAETLKALSTVIIKGRITDNNNVIASDFNGSLNAALFDKKTSFATIGRNNPAYTFKEWFNPLFRGNARVKDGMFEFELMVPKNIAYEVDAGKLSLYAYNNELTTDASGGTTSFNVGGSEENVADDSTPPNMQVFLGDTTFIDGGSVSPNTLLVVKLADESGINISNYGIGNTAVAVLDNDSETFILNEYYEAVSGTFKEGWINFPLENLTPGPHSITVTVWDSYNNPTEKTVHFNVTETAYLQIETFGNYPNPFPGETTFFFTHNRPGDDLNLTLQILSAAGQQLKELHFFLPSSSFKEELEFDDSLIFGQKLAPGLYFGRVIVRSGTDGGESSAVTKLIVSN